MTEGARFRIVYENPRAPVAMPELYETYDVESAFYDYLPAKARATIVLDGYALELPDVKLVFLVRRALKLAEGLRARIGDVPAEPMDEIPEIPPEAKVRSIMFADFMLWFPVLIFAQVDDTTRIYTRTLSEEDRFRLIVLPERDRASPVVVPTRDIIEEIRAFMTSYLDDIAAAFPFITGDELYLRYRGRIAALGA